MHLGYKTITLQPHIHHIRRPTRTKIEVYHLNALSFFLCLCESARDECEVMQSSV